MRRIIRLGPPVPPNRIARWAVPGIIGTLAVLGVVQQQRSLALALPALAAVAAAAALLTTPGRPARFTAGVALMAGALAVLGNGSASDLGWFGVCVLAGWCAYVGSVPVTMALWAASMITFSLEWVLTTDDRGWASQIAGTTFATFGLLLTRRERDLAERLRVAQAGLADRARVQERNRIARELHDVIAHSVSVMVIQAGVERRTLGPGQESTGEALRLIEDSGRDVLGELRRLLGVMRAPGRSPSRSRVRPGPRCADRPTRNRGRRVPAARHPDRPARSTRRPAARDRPGRRLPGSPGP